MKVWLRRIGIILGGLAALLLIALTITMYAAGPDAGVLPGLSGFDLFVGAFSAILLAIFLVQTWRTGRMLSDRDSRPG